MSLALRLCSLLLFAMSFGAVAQSGTDATNAKPPRPQLPSVTPGLGSVVSDDEIRVKGAEWRAECMRDWDRETHMTKQEWARTCQRVVEDRVQWLRGLGKR